MAGERHHIQNRSTQHTHDKKPESKPHTDTTYQPTTNISSTNLNQNQIQSCGQNFGSLPIPKNPFSKPELSHYVDIASKPIDLAESKVYFKEDPKNPY